MIVRIEYDLSIEEDKFAFDCGMLGKEFYSQLSEIKSLIRARLKYGDGVSDAEAVGLEELRNIIDLGNLE